MKTKIIGIAGVAGAGKDLFYKLLSKKIKCKRFSLGDELKKEVKSYCLEHFNIDPTNCSREEKNIIRKCLVSHASVKRSITKGRYWLDKVDKQIKYHIFNQLRDGLIEDYCCITDIRYNEYEHDEVSWLKNELGGVLVHISQFKMAGNKKIFLPPANADEASQEDGLKQCADYSYECEFIKGTQKEIEKKLSDSLVKDFIKIIKK